jgi:hypothetical protein
MTPEWDQWKGAMDAKMETAGERFQELEARLKHVEEKVSEVVAKLSVPLFIAGISGPIIGALIVYVLTKQIK